MVGIGRAHSHVSQLAQRVALSECHQEVVRVNRRGSEHLVLAVALDQARQKSVWLKALLLTGSER